MMTDKELENLKQALELVRVAKEQGDFSIFDKFPIRKERIYDLQNECGLSLWGVDHSYKKAKQRQDINLSLLLNQWVKTTEAIRYTLETLDRIYNEFTDPKNGYGDRKDSKGYIYLNPDTVHFLQDYEKDHFGEVRTPDSTFEKGDEAENES